MKDDRKKYLRQYKRDYKSKPWLNDIENEAEKSGLSLREATDLILQRVVDRKLLTALLKR